MLRARFRIGRLAPHDCDVVRLTLQDNLTTDSGLAKAIEAVSAPDYNVLLFAALPCTGGSPWQNMNWRLGPKTQAKINAHRAVFRLLWRSFERTARSLPPELRTHRNRVAA